MDDRIVAEILLRFYEDLALPGKAEPLPDLSGRPLSDPRAMRPPRGA
jgi:hypothetical protein